MIRQALIILAMSCNGGLLATAVLIMVDGAIELATRHGLISLL